jgi:hypothetical protein
LEPPVPTDAHAADAAPDKLAVLHRGLHRAVEVVQLGLDAQQPLEHVGGVLAHRVVVAEAAADIGDGSEL